MKVRIKLLQVILKDKKLYTSSIDGIAGKGTVKAIHKLGEEIKAKWPKKRKIIGALQLLAKEFGIPAGPIDGFWGPMTTEAFEELKCMFSEEEADLFVRPEDHEIANPNEWPKQYTKEFDNFYGDQGDDLTLVKSPYPLKLSWDKKTTTSKIRCHKKVAPSLERILNRVLKEYGLEEIQRLKLDVYGGCFVKRTIRGGKKPSMHSWGVALDFDPDNNRLRWGAEKATFAKAAYKKWWDAWEDEGWVSLGRQRNFDWMHVQAAVL